MAFQKSNSFTITISNFILTFNVDCVPYEDYGSPYVLDVLYGNTTTKLKTSSAPAISQYLRYFKITLKNIAFDTTHNTPTNKFCEINDADSSYISTLCNDCYIKMTGGVFAQQDEGSTVDSGAGTWVSYDNADYILKIGDSIEKDYSESGCIPFQRSWGSLFYYLNHCDLSKEINAVYTNLITDHDTTTINVSYYLNDGTLNVSPSYIWYEKGGKKVTARYATSPNSSVNSSYSLITDSGTHNFSKITGASNHSKSGNYYLGVVIDDQFIPIGSSGSGAYVYINIFPTVLFKCTKIELYTSNGVLIGSKDFSSSIDYNSVGYLPLAYGLYSNWYSGVSLPDELQPDVSSMNGTITGSITKTTKYDSYIFAKDTVINKIMANGKEVGYVVKDGKIYYTCNPKSNDYCSVEYSFS